VVNAKKLESSLSNGRKLFRLSLWLNELTELNELTKNPQRTLMHVLKVLSTFCSFWYYLADNLVFFAKLDFLNDKVPGTTLKFKRIKNLFSLLKTVLEILIAVYQVLLKSRKLNKLLHELGQWDKDWVHWRSKANWLLREILILRH
jgi:hypothetical protein